MVDWTSPKTWSPGDILPAGDLNTYVRDNSLFLHGAAVPIQTASPAAGTAVSFTSIPQDFRHLEIVGRGARNNVGMVVLLIRLNGDDQANYMHLVDRVDGAGTRTVDFNNTATEYRMGMWGSQISMAQVWLPDYSLVGTKVIESSVSGRDGATGAENERADGHGRWRIEPTTDAVTHVHITVQNGFSAGTRWTLYGRRG